jgi:glyoxylase-like metal-dependent hydrolase (beta-lactamase superfamily II)
MDNLSTLVDLDAVAKPHVEPFFDPNTWTMTYVVVDQETRSCVVIDPVLDLDYPSGSIRTQTADRIVDYVKSGGLTVADILETHVHADHLTSAPYLKEQLGGLITIGSEITTVQKVFKDIFNENDTFPTDGSQFDLILKDGANWQVGGLECHALHVPGHTPACLAYLIGDTLFVGDTLFMPDAGTARCDFPGGDARTLFRSIRRLLTLPDQVRVFVCHDYQPNGRELRWESTIAEQRMDNIHVNESICENEFVAMREARDATLGMPTLILPSLQVNMRAGRLPSADSGGRLFLKVPINAFGGDDLSRFASE